MGICEGGKIRTFGLNKKLSNNHDREVVLYGHNGLGGKKKVSAG